MKILNHFNNELNPSIAVVMRAVWELDGWSTIDEICSQIWQEGFSRNKVYKYLRILSEINFVSVKKYKGRNYYAQRISATQYYPDLHHDSLEYIANEQIKITGINEIKKIKSIKNKLK